MWSFTRRAPKSDDKRRPTPPTCEPAPPFASFALQRFSTSAKSAMLTFTSPIFCSLIDRLARLCWIDPSCLTIAVLQVALNKVFMMNSTATSVNTSGASVFFEADVGRSCGARATDLLNCGYKIGVIFGVERAVVGRAVVGRAIVGHAVVGRATVADEAASALWLPSAASSLFASDVPAGSPRGKPRSLARPECSAWFQLLELSLVATNHEAAPLPRNAMQCFFVKVHARFFFRAMPS
mmetsp:Transcript_116638/g.329908  ORF Transcript_116638/g.329908 Transcript_116638/m.329908 type:complete len:238 (-) Transcript_116638:62-775(-)